MKTVIVIDTEDSAGMESTRRIVNHLLETYHKVPANDDPFGTKIRAIKSIRGYLVWLKKEYPDTWMEEVGSLRTSKQYVETFDKFRPGRWKGI